jgi:hypothetical protein
MFLVDERAQSEHVQVIRCNIKPGSIERSRDVKMVRFQKKSKGITLRPRYKTPPHFLMIEVI